MRRRLPSDTPTFGDLLRHQRRARELTQEALAERAGVSARAISDLERGARSHPYRETVHLLADALQLSGSDRAALVAAGRRPPRSAAPPAHGFRGAWLPGPLTPLIGREEELRDVTGSLREERVRLLTLSGPPGVGKTRLALAAAAGLADAFPDGIVFLDLAPLRDPALILSALAAVLGLPDKDSASLLESLRRTLGRLRILLLFDNFEHLLPAAPQVSALLQAGSGIQALITSRTRLRLRGEREVSLAPLATPMPGAPVSADALAAWPAIQLFVERVHDVHPGFQLDEANAAAVAGICQRLDGLPLAIELAAARAKTLPPPALLARLEPRLPLLTAGMRDAPSRHQTLQTAIAWSYDLLAPHEQALLRCLAVFTGGWTLGGAERVGALCDVPHVLDALAVLGEHHLVVRDDTIVEPRYRMLETIREFALERLEAMGEGDRARRAHLQYLAHLARENNLERLDAETETRLNRLLAEENNLRAGIEWGAQHDPEMALEILAALGYFWMLADRPGPGRELHERILQTGAGAYRPERAKVLQQAAWLIAYVGDSAPAAPLADAARALADRLAEKRTSAHAQMCQGSIAQIQGDARSARVLLSGALAAFEALQDDWGAIVCLTEIGIAALDWGELETALTAFARVDAIVAARHLTARYRAHSLLNLAEVNFRLGHPDVAWQACTEALALMPAVARPRSVQAGVQLIVAHLLLEDGDPPRAAERIASSLGVFWEMGDWWNTAQALEAAGAAMTVGEQFAQAARCFAAADALRLAMPLPIGASQEAIVARHTAAVRARLDPAAFSGAWADGHARSLDASVAEARAILAAMAMSA